MTDNPDKSDESTANPPEGSKKKRYLSPKKNPDSNYLRGWKEIYAYFGRQAHVVRRWHIDYAFPLAHEPNGAVCSTKTLIDEWVRMRSLYQMAMGRHRAGKEVPEELIRLFTKEDAVHGKTGRGTIGKYHPKKRAKQRW